MAFQLRTTDFKISRMNGSLRPCTTGDRWRRAITHLGIFWGLGLAAILIPVLHFVLVPLFTVIGAVAFVRGFKITHLIESAEGPCPACGRPLRLTQLFVAGERPLACAHCGSQLKLDSARCEEPGESGPYRQRPIIPGG